MKELDQDARGSVCASMASASASTRSFIPALLKPAPTRLRLVLWSLANGLDEFPESPPPGLVTDPQPWPMTCPRATTTLSGYHACRGERAIRIDMLERLADMIRVTRQPRRVRGDSRHAVDHRDDAGTVFRPDGAVLGYRAERGERPKVKPVEAPEAPAPDAAVPSPAAEVETPAAARRTRCAGRGQRAESPAARCRRPAADPAAEEGARSRDRRVFYTFDLRPRVRTRGNAPTAKAVFAPVDARAPSPNRREGGRPPPAERAAEGWRAAKERTSGSRAASARPKGQKGDQKPARGKSPRGLHRPARTPGIRPDRSRQPLCRGADVAEATRSEGALAEAAPERHSPGQMAAGTRGSGRPEALATADGGGAARCG